MKHNDTLNEIYNTIKELYGNCTAVEILVNSEGIEVKTYERPFTKNYSMRTLNGEWLEKKEE